MGQLAEALRDPRRRRAIEEEGAELDYTDAFEMLDDMVALRRAFPDATILANELPLERRVGFLAYWLREGEEVVVYFGMGMATLKMWSMEASDRQRATILADSLLKSDGRINVLRVVEQEAAKPRPTQLTGEEYRPSIWERLMADED